LKNLTWVAGMDGEVNSPIHCIQISLCEALTIYLETLTVRIGPRCMRMMSDHLTLTDAPARATALISGALAFFPPFDILANDINHLDELHSLTSNRWVVHINDRSKIGRDWP
jgi:hypothetical protein